jgi:hypothetical protein
MAGLVNPHMVVAAALPLSYALSSPKHSSMGQLLSAAAPTSPEKEANPLGVLFGFGRHPFLLLSAEILRGFMAVVWHISVGGAPESRSVVRCCGRPFQTPSSLVWTYKECHTGQTDARDGRALRAWIMV